MLTFTAGVTMLAAVVAGLAPALKATRPNLVDELKGDVAAARAGGRRWTLRDGLVVTQIAVTMVLLVAAGLLTRSLSRGAKGRASGFSTGGLAIVSTEMSMLGYERRAVEGVLRCARSSASGRFPASSRPRSPSACRSRSTTTATIVFLPDRHGPNDKGLVIDVARVSAEYFRDARRADRAGAQLRARPTRRRRRASRSSTRRWRGSTGRTRTRSASDSAPPRSTAVSAKWSACQRDYKVSTVGEGATPYIHYAVAQRPDSGEEIVARTRGDAGALLAAMRRELLALEPNVLFLDNQTMDAQVAATLLPAKAGAISVSAVGVVAMAAGVDRPLRRDRLLGGAAHARDRHPHGARREAVGGRRRW